MLPIIDSPQRRAVLRKTVASVDFVVGFFLLFGGMNLAYHEELGGLGVNQSIGITSMVLGFALFFSSVFIVRNRVVSFRPYIYLSIAFASTGFLLYQYLRHTVPLDKGDLLVWSATLAVTALCGGLQPVLKNRTPSK